MNKAGRRSGGDRNSIELQDNEEQKGDENEYPVGKLLSQVSVKSLEEEAAEEAR